MFLTIDSLKNASRTSAFFAAVGIAAVLSLPVSTVAQEAPAYTGVVIDARHYTEINRSPAPVIYGPTPVNQAVYPDPHCVPTADQVQDQSVVRYYQTEADAETRLVGDHPLILKAEDLVGPGHDSVRLSAEDAEQLKTLDKTLHFTRTWKVAFLVPEGR